MEEVLCTLALFCGAQGIAQELWVGLDLPGAVAFSIDEVPGVVIILDEFVQFQAKLLDIGMNQPGAETEITQPLFSFLLVSQQKTFPGKPCLLVCLEGLTISSTQILTSCFWGCSLPGGCRERGD